MLSRNSLLYSLLLLHFTFIKSKSSIKDRKEMMLKQKIVLEVHMPCNKCKIKAMTIAAQTQGMISLAMDADNNKLVIVGEDMDLAFLVTTLRKKVGRTTIISVGEVISEAKKKEEEAKKKKEEEEKKKKEEEEEAAKFRNVPPNYDYFNSYAPPPVYPGYDFRYGAPSYPHTWFS